ncbi:MAG: hypothetical protein ACD_39C01177G0002 [uncultured bacterium]|nr:MAG: hypothetical protein ACD_39C01177G0002 [uncultured bacterium]
MLRHFIPVLLQQGVIFFVDSVQGGSQAGRIRMEGLVSGVVVALLHLTEKIELGHGSRVPGKVFIV